MKYVIVGDIHGRVEQVEEALSRDGTIIFVGDFLDSFNRSVGDQVRSLTLALDAVDAGKAKAIFGNHELSYLMHSTHGCSGWRAETKALVSHLEKRMYKTMVPFVRLPSNFLVTHAGAMPKVLPHIDELNFADARSPMHWIGRCRGGRDPVGGVFWCDFNDEFVPTDGVNQVFGHTAKGGTAIRKLPDSLNYCVDCLEHKTEFLELDL